MSPTGSRTVQSVARALELVEWLRALDGATITELAEHVDLTPGTIHSHLATLREGGLVVKRGDAYALGPELLTLGEYVRNHSPVYQAAKDEVERLAAETGESAHLIVEHDGRIYALYERFGGDAVGVEYHDRKREVPLRHLHCTAAGKAILSAMPRERVAAIVAERGLPATTRNTITDPDALHAELERTRERGYAVADEEQLTGIRAVGAPVRNEAGEAVAAIAVDGPTSRMSGERFESTIPAAVVSAANIVEVGLQTDELADLSP